MDGRTDQSAYCLSLWSAEWPLTAAVVKPLMQTEDNWQIPCRNDLLNQWIPRGSDKDYPVVSRSLLGLVRNTPCEVQYFCKLLDHYALKRTLIACPLLHYAFIVLVIKFVCCVYIVSSLSVILGIKGGFQMETWFHHWDRLCHINLYALSSFSFIFMANYISVIVPMCVHTAANIFV